MICHSEERILDSQVAWVAPGRPQAARHAVPSPPVAAQVPLHAFFSYLQVRVQATLLLFRPEEGQQLCAPFPPPPPPPSTVWQTALCTGWAACLPATDMLAAAAPMAAGTAPAEPQADLGLHAGGRVSKVGPDFIALLVLDVFNAAVGQDDIRPDVRHDKEVCGCADLGHAPAQAVQADARVTAGRPLAESGAAGARDQGRRHRALHSPQARRRPGQSGGLHIALGSPGRAACRVSQASGIVSIQGSLQDASTGSLAFLSPQPGAGTSAEATPAAAGGDMDARLDQSAGDEPAAAGMDVSKAERRRRKAERRAQREQAAQQAVAVTAARQGLASRSTPQDSATGEAEHRKHKRRKHRSLPNGLAAGAAGSAWAAGQAAQQAVADAPMQRVVSDGKQKKRQGKQRRMDTQS